MGLARGEQSCPELRLLNLQAAARFLQRVLVPVEELEGMVTDDSYDSNFFCLLRHDMYFSYE